METQTCLSTRPHLVTQPWAEGRSPSPRQSIWVGQNIPRTTLPLHLSMTVTGSLLWLLGSHCSLGRGSREGFLSSLGPMRTNEVIFGDEAVCTAPRTHTYAHPLVHTCTSFSGPLLCTHGQLLSAPDTERGFPGSTGFPWSGRMPMVRTRRMAPAQPTPKRMTK